MAITTAVSDFVSSIYELIASFVTTFFHLIQTIFNSVIGFVTGFFNLVVGTIGSILGVVGETGKFLIGNALILVIVGVGVLAWLNYMKSQGKPVVVGNKKLN